LQYGIFSFSISDYVVMNTQTVLTQKEKRRQAMSIVYHVIRRHKGGWDFIREDTHRIIRHAEDKMWLTEFAESYCRTHPCELIVHKMNGNIAWRQSFEGRKGFSKSNA